MLVLAKVESSTVQLLIRKIRLTTENTAVPKYLAMAAGWPPSMPV